MTRQIALTFLLVLWLCSCGESASSVQPRTSLELSLTLPDGTNIDHVDYTVSGGPLSIARSGSVNVQRSTILRLRIGALPVGADYTLTLGATTREGVPCGASDNFAVVDSAVGPLAVTLRCAGTVIDADGKGDLSVQVDVAEDGGVCPAITGMTALPLEVDVGSSLRLAGFTTSSEGVSFAWSGGRFDSPASANTQYTCVRPGQGQPTLTVTKPGCAPRLARVEVSCDDAVCAECLDRNCGRYTGDFDVFQLCVNNPDPNFTQLCVDAYECSLAAADRCADDLTRGPVSCYCGLDRSIDDCFKAPSATTGPIGACIPEWEAATGCTPGDVPCVSARLVSLTYASGMAYFAIGCTAGDCAQVCRP